MLRIKNLHVSIDGKEILKGVELIVKPGEIHAVMGDNGYDYLVIGGIEVKNYGFNKTVELINDLASSKLFTVEQQGEAALIFKIV